MCDCGKTHAYGLLYSIFGVQYQSFLAHDDLEVSKKKNCRNIRLLINSHVSGNEKKHDSLKSPTANYMLLAPINLSKHIRLIPYRRVIV